jgi:hypothetical protein
MSRSWLTFVQPDMRININAAIIFGMIAMSDLQVSRYIIQSRSMNFYNRMPSIYFIYFESGFNGLPDLNAMRLKQPKTIV